MPIGDYCRRPVETVGLEATLREAARRMRDAGVGSLVVVRDDARIAGVVTDRDVALRVLHERHDPDKTAVHQILEAEPVVVHASSPLALAAGVMRRRAVRRLPVVDDDERLLGVISWDDLVRLVGRELSGVADIVATQAPDAGGRADWDVDAEPEVE